MTLILAIEDNLDVAARLRCDLEVEGFQVEVATRIPDGLAMIRTLSPALVILNVALRDADGREVLSTVQRERVAVPILVLSARSDEQTKLQCFDFGVEDYITTPVSTAELVARVHAVLRRTSAESVTKHAWIRIGEIAIHPPTRSVRRAGQRVVLRPKEYDLLLTLIRNRGRIVSREVLLREVWKRGDDTATRTVDNHVLGLRRKLEPDPSCPVHIVTAYSVGYMLRR
jgi:two-component system, OmpR family, alkaline phosphatase synthesis response regulator PhoP